MAVDLARTATRIALLVMLATRIEAGPVSGTITLNGHPFNGTMTLPNGATIPVRDGRYQISLPPGTYTLVFTGEGGSWSKSIESAAAPVTENIHLP